MNTIEFDLPVNEKDGNSVWNITLGTPLTLAESVILTSPVTDSLVVNGNITLTTATLTVAGARNITINGTIRDGAGTAGLLEGRISHPNIPFDETTPNPATAVQSGPRLGQTALKPPPAATSRPGFTPGSSTTPTASSLLPNNIDDNVSIKIDGVLRLRSALKLAEVWWTATTTRLNHRLLTVGGGGVTADANPNGGTTNFGMGPQGRWLARHRNPHG